MTLKAMLAATALLGVLSGCAQINDFTGRQEQAAPVQEPQFFENAYAARSAGKFDVPAVPEDEIPVAYRRQIVSYETEEAPGTIIVDPVHAVLYLVQPEGKAIRYGISVGRDGFGWSGTSVVARKAQWPTWTPPASMIERQPSLEKWRDGQPGGPTNPLGARALYLYINGKDYGFRIHGTPEWRTIGKRASSGCFRMIQQDVIDLYERVPDGTKVIVLNSEGEIPTKLTLPPPSPAPKKPAAKPVAKTAVPATVSTSTLEAEPEDEVADDLAEDTAEALETNPPADEAAPDEGTLPDVAPAEDAAPESAPVVTPAPEAEAPAETEDAPETEVFTDPAR
ncbi:L,D-transpeptidase [Falsirhodobacter algicola]|uniref:L,D-transpeptidase n=1 Tax=Falsirhodobacter algicola TaxID=2692330 RepID=UPI001BA8C8B9|nr:L,D-transpeptidase [Falsirhodobacter algicola]